MATRPLKLNGADMTQRVCRSRPTGLRKRSQAIRVTLRPRCVAARVHTSPLTLALHSLHSPPTPSHGFRKGARRKLWRHPAAEAAQRSAHEQKRPREETAARGNKRVSPASKSTTDHPPPPAVAAAAPEARPAESVFLSRCSCSLPAASLTPRSSPVCRSIAELTKNPVDGFSVGLKDDDNIYGQRGIAQQQQQHARCDACDGCGRAESSDRASRWTILDRILIIALVLVRSQSGNGSPIRACASLRALLRACLMRPLSLLEAHSCRLRVVLRMLRRLQHDGGTGGQWSDDTSCCVRSLAFECGSHVSLRLCVFRMRDCLRSMQGTD